MKGFTVFLVMALLSCKVKQQVAEVQSIQQIVKEKLGKTVEPVPNTSGKYILYVQQVDPNFPMHMIKAIVINSSTHKIMAEESFVPGYIKWVSETSLEVLSLPGMIKRDEDLSRYIRLIKLNSPKSDL